MKGKKSAVPVRVQYEERTEAIAAPIAEGFGIYIYDVEYVREGEEYYLNVYIDKEGGVTINDCESVSRLLSDELDRADFIPDAYTLIVSSPGLGRSLTKDRHLRGEKYLRGELLDFNDTQIKLNADEPVPAKGKGKGKAKKKAAAKKAAAEETLPGSENGDTTTSSTDTAADTAVVSEDGRRMITLDRKSVASIRLAFDF